MEENGITLDELSRLLGKAKKALRGNLDGVRGDLRLHDAVMIRRTYGAAAGDAIFGKEGLIIP